MVAVHGMPRGIAAAHAAALALLVAYAADLALGASASSAGDLPRALAYDALIAIAGALVVARALARTSQRGAWACLGAGLTCWAAGELVFTLFLAGTDPTPIPSASDALMLAFYPACYAALLLLARSGGVRTSTVHPFDGLTALLVIGAVAAALFVEPVGSATGRGAAAAVVELAYPVGDLLLLTTVIGVFALRGWRPDLVLGSLGAALVVLVLADVLFLYLGAHNRYSDGMLLGAAWPAVALLIARTAWLPDRGASPGEASRPRTALVSGILALPAIAVLGADLVGEPVPDVAVGLATAALATVVLRLAATATRTERRLRVERHRAANDGLTGLPNRGELLADLELLLADAEVRSPTCLLILDLDGFKSYNETFGHPAGDELLGRLSERLKLAIEPHGRAYRLGGDEFAALVRGGQDRARAAEFVARWALSQTTRRIEITPSCGRVELPREATNPSAALALANSRLCEDRQVSRSRHGTLRSVGS